MNRTDDVKIEIDGYTYEIKNGSLSIKNLRYDFRHWPELYAIVYAFADLEKAYAEDT